MNKLLTTLAIIIISSSCNNGTNKAGKENAEVKVFASPADSVSAEPCLFTDKHGVVYLSWVVKTKEKSFLKFSTLNNGEWSKSVMIASGEDWFVNWADYPMLVSDGEGNMLANFMEKSERGKYTYDVKFVASSDNGISWSNPKLLNDDGKKAEHGFVSVVPYGKDFFISWLDGRNTTTDSVAVDHDGHHGAMSIRATIVDKQGTKINEWELDSRVCDCCQTSAAITANGPIVVYRDRTESEIRGISIVRLVNGKWTQPRSIFSDNWKIAGCPVNGPQADAVGNNLAVTWFSSPDSSGRVNLAFSADGGENFNSPIRIDEGKPIGRVDVIMLDEKSAMVSWMEGEMIKAARVYNDGKKDPSLTIASSSESRSSGFPQMTRSGKSLIFAWTDNKERIIRVAALDL